MSQEAADDGDYFDSCRPGTILDVNEMTSRSSVPVVELSGLRKRFGTTRAVDGVDLTVDSGEVVALLGPNGAGKSTTVDLLLGLTRPDEGTARLFGTSPRQACASGRVGAILQNGGVIPDLTVREVL